MSLNDPTRRPWGTAQGASRTILFIWTGIALLSLASAVCIVLALSRPIDFSPTATILAVISVIAGVAGMHFDFATAQRRGAGVAVGVAHLFGAWISGAGGGIIVTAALSGQLGSLLSLSGLLILGVGVAIFLSPNVLERYRAAAEIRHDRVRSTGAHVLATVTSATMVSLNDSLRFRVTLRFTDQEGAQRWFTRTAPPATVDISEDDTIPMHYDPQNPGDRRSLVVDWPTYD